MSANKRHPVQKKLRTSTQEEIDAELSRLYILRDQVRHPVSGLVGPRGTRKYQVPQQLWEYVPPFWTAELITLPNPCTWFFIKSGMLQGGL